MNQLATALTADLMPSQAPVTTLRKVSLLFQAYTSPAASAASASTIRPTGLAFMTTLRAACAAVITLVRADTISCHAAYPIMAVFQVTNPAAMAAIVPLCATRPPRKSTIFGTTSLTTGTTLSVITLATFDRMSCAVNRKSTMPLSSSRPKRLPSKSPLTRMS